jgi:hypothetical protein
MTLSLPYIEVYYEDLLNNDGWHQNMEVFLNIGEERLRQEIGMNSLPVFAVHVPPHLQLSKKTPVKPNKMK